MKFILKYSLSTRFLIILIPTVVSFMIVLYVFLEINTFYKIKNSQQRRIETLANFSSSALSSPLWNYDLNAINFVLSSLPLEPDFLEASVFDHNNKKIMSIGDTTGFKNIQIINTIRYDRGYGLKNIGKIVIHLRQKTLLNNIFDKVYESLIMMGFIIMAILIAIIFGTKKILSIPLQKLASSIEKTNNLESPSPVEWKSQDELGKLINGYNKMIARLKKSDDERILTKKALKEYTGQLEEMVGQRTKELHETQEQLVRSEKMVALGKLAGVLGHEIKAPIGVMKNSFEFLKIRLDKSMDEKIPKHLQIVSRQLKIIDRTIDDVLDFARTKGLKLTTIDPNNLVKSALNRISIPANSNIVHDYGKDLPHITVDEHQIHQVILNIVANAFDAMDEGGTLLVRTGTLSFGKKTAQGIEQAMKKGTEKTMEKKMEPKIVTISFQDTGSGIPRDHLDKIFEPLFTTKVKGVGLGLAACENIIHAHKGSLEVTSEPGKGSTFVIKLSG